MSVNKISDAVRKKCFKNWRYLTSGKQPVIIKLCVFIMESANKHDGNGTDKNIKLSACQSLQVSRGILSC